MKNQYKKNIEIDAVVVMPRGEIKPSYGGERIYFEEDEKGNRDFIELHYMEITSNITPDSCYDVKFETSMNS